MREKERVRQTEREREREREMTERGSDRDVQFHSSVIARVSIGIDLSDNKYL